MGRVLMITEDASGRDEVRSLRLSLGNMEAEFSVMSKIGIIICGSSGKSFFSLVTLEDN